MRAKRASTAKWISDISLMYWSLVGLVFLFVWFGIMGLFSEFSKMGTQQSLEFAWQQILLSFGFAAALAALPERIVPKRLGAVLVVLFTLSGAGVLWSFGVANFGFLQQMSFVFWTGTFAFVLSIVPLALGIAIIVIESLKKALSAFR